MLTTWWAAFLAAALLAGAAMAQAGKVDPVSQGLSLAMQQLGVSATMYVDEMQRRLAEKDARIAELEKLCGDACKKDPK